MKTCRISGPFPELVWSGCDPGNGPLIVVGNHRRKNHFHKEPRSAKYSPRVMKGREATPVCGRSSRHKPASLVSSLRGSLPPSMEMKSVRVLRAKHHQFLKRLDKKNPEWQHCHDLQTRPATHVKSQSSSTGGTASNATRLREDQGDARVRRLSRGQRSLGV
jgi:hypothetical protein